MELITLNVITNPGERAKDTRNSGRIPLVQYGKGIEKNDQYTVDYQDFRRAYAKGGKSTIYNLVIDGKEGEEHMALVHEVQYDPVTDNIDHVDLMAVQKGTKITTDIPLTFVGTAPAVKDEGGILVQSKDTIHIECLPKDLVHDIEVDISSLVDFHSSITVADLKVPETITILDAEDVGIATVSAPRTEAEVEADEAPVAAEGEEGEAPADSEGGDEAPTEEAKEEGGDAE